MKNSILLVASVLFSIAVFAQSPKPEFIPEYKWNLNVAQDLSTAYRLTNDSMLYIAFDKEIPSKSVVKIKTEEGATIYRKKYNDDVKMTRFDVSDFPVGGYKVEFYDNGSLTSTYSFYKN